MPRMGCSHGETDSLGAMPETPLIGREDTLPRIIAAWERLVSGRAGPVAVTVTGEAGIGKTRLLREAVAAIGPARLLAGTARADGAAPHDWFAAATADAARPEGADERLWRVLRQEPMEERLSLPDGAMLRAAVAAVRRLVDEGPALLVVDDLHWLDPESLALWSELAATWDLPAMLLACSRDPEEARHPAAVSRALARLGASGGGERIVLRPLSVEETGALVGAHTGELVTRSAARSIHRRTGGVPFWIGELAVAGLTDRAPLPGHLAALARSRLAGADREAWRLARAAALLGERMDLAVLEKIAGAASVASALPQLTAAGVLVRIDESRVVFPHALMREAFAATVLPEEARAVHGAALREARERGDDAAIAVHAEALGDTAQAVAATARIARRQLESRLPDSARQTAETGLRWETDHAALLEIAGRAAMLSGDFAGARGHFERLAAGGERACAAHLRLCEIAWHQGRIGDQWAHLEAAEALAAPGGVEHSRCLAVRAMCSIRSEDYAAALQAADAALPLAERHGRDATRRSVEISRATALHYSGDAPGAVEALRRVWRDAEAAGDLHRLVRAVNNLLAVQLDRLPEPQAWRLFRSGVDAVGEMGMALWGGKIHRVGADAAMRFGDLGRAWELLSSRVGEEPDPHERAVLAAKAGLLAVERDDLDAAERLHREGSALATGMDQGWVVTYQHWLAVAIAARRGEKTAVEAAVHAYRDAVPPELHRKRAHRVLEVACLAIEQRIEPAAVRRFVVDCLGEVPAPGGGPAADLLWMAMRSVQGDWRGAVSRLEGVLDDDAAIVALPARRATAFMLAAEARRRLGDPRAVDHAETAVALLRRWPGWRRREAEAFRAGFDPVGASPLTGRETEVLEAAARGRSNRQIASELGISQRTVEVHMSRVLAKTGAASRTAAVAGFLRRE